MPDIESFVRKFTDQKIDYTMIGNALFVPSEVPTDEHLHYMSTRLGYQQGKKFTPSPALLEILNDQTDRKATINEKSTWLFLCGKNVLKEGIISKTVEEGFVLVNNERGENLGYGKITGAGITNMLDRGDFLRRER